MYKLVGRPKGARAVASLLVEATPPWLLPDPSGNLISYPNGRHYLDTPVGDWTFVVSAPEFPTAWDLLNATAPNGEMEAWRYIEGGSGAGNKAWTSWVAKTKSLGTSPQTFTGSIYAKRTASNDRNLGLVIQSPHNGDNYGEAYYDLTTGAISLTGQLDSATLLATDSLDAGDGWWRCRIAVQVAEANAEVAFSFYAALTSGATFNNRVVYTGNGASGLYLWRGRLAEGNEIS